MYSVNYLNKKNSTINYIYIYIVSDKYAVSVLNIEFKIRKSTSQKMDAERVDIDTKRLVYLP